VRDVASETVLSGVNPSSTTLADSLEHALDTAPEGLEVLDPPPASSARDLLRSLEVIYDLSRGPLDPLDGRSRYACTPVLSRVRNTLEEAWLAELLEANPEADDVLAELTSMVSSTPVHVDLARDPSHELLEEALVLAFDVTRRMDTLPGRLADALGHALTPPLDHHHDAAGTLSVHDLATAERSDALVGLSALAGLVGLNHWLAPEGLGVLALHQLQRIHRSGVELEAYRALGGGPREAAFPAEPSDAVVVVSVVLQERPHWGPRVLRGAYWYHELDAQAHALSREASGLGLAMSETD
jgi:hypothetical protein